MAFIVGIGRSGTTMLTNMLNSNPEVISTPENEFLLFTHSSFKNKDFSSPKNVDSFLAVFEYDFNKVLSVWQPNPKVREEILNLKEKSYADVCKQVYLNYPFSNKDNQAVKCIVDKNPVYSLYIDKISEIYPKAKYIVIVRDFRDNVLSRRKYSSPGSSVYNLAVTWNYFYDSVFHSINKNNLDHYILRYEDLVTSPEATLRKLCSFMGVNYTPDMLAFQSMSKKLKEHVKETRNEEIYKKISGMHSNLDKAVNSDRVNSFETELSKKEIEIIDYICYKYAQKFNYKTGNKTVSATDKFRILISEIFVRTFYRIKQVYYSIPTTLRMPWTKKI
jgi:hypothetical protein